MKVLQVIESLTRGGAERLVVELASEFARLGLESRVLCLSEPGPWAAQLQSKGIYAGCLHKKRGADLSILRKIRSACRTLAPDVVHTHLFTANLWTRLAGLPGRDWSLVVTLHNIDDWRAPLHRFIDRALVPAADRYVAVGQGVARYYRSEGIPAGRMCVIPNAVRWSDTPCPPALVSALPTIRACGRLVPQKGFDRLIEATSILAARRVPFKMEVIGDGPERVHLKGLIESLGLSERVCLLGARDDARTLIASSDIFVMPSLREGLPLVLLEALHAARPIVASDLPVLAGVVENNREALLVEPGSPQALAAAIEILLADPSRARAIGQAGRLQAISRYTIERAASSYVDLYRELGRERGK